MQTKYYVWLAAVVGIIIGVGAWLVFAPKTAVAPGTSSPTASTTTTDLGGGVQITATGGVTVKEVTGQTTSTPPAIAPLAVSPGTSADLKAALQSQYDTLTAQIKTAPTRIDRWLQLGIVYKIAGDYPAAVTAWTYVAQAGMGSTSAVAYGNLGDLYLNFTHEYAKAEASYKAALKLSPGSADYRAGLAAALQAQGK